MTPITPSTGLSNRFTFNSISLKAFVFAIFATVFAIPVAKADGFRREKTLGLQAGYISHNESAVAGVEFTYRFSRHFRVAPSVVYAFRHHNRDAMIISVDAQTPIPFGRGLEWFPCAGINYSTWTHHSHRDGLKEDYHDVTSRESRFGLNLGGGFALNLTPTLQLGIKAEYLFITHTSGTTVTARIAYRF